MDRDIFAKRLKTLRLSRNLTLQNVGDAVGSNRQVISNMEHTHISPSLNMALALADLFGVSVDYLVGRSDSPAEGGGEMSEEFPAFARTPEQKKLYEMIEALREDNSEKALSYVAYLRHLQRREDRRARREASGGILPPVIDKEAPQE